MGKNANITNVERLHYLKTLLKGQAEIIIKHLTTTNEKFQCEWTILTEYYENHTSPSPLGRR